MIAELAINVEETFGLVATRLCRALHSKGLVNSSNHNIFIYELDTSHHRFRHLCCIPAFIIVTIQISLTSAFTILALMNGKILIHVVLDHF